MGQEGQTGRSKLRRRRRSHCDRTIYSGLPRKPSNKGGRERGGGREREAREMLRSDGNGREGGSEGGGEQARTRGMAMRTGTRRLHKAKVRSIQIFKNRNLHNKAVNKTFRSIKRYLINYRQTVAYENFLISSFQRGEGGGVR